MMKQVVFFEDVEIWTPITYPDVKQGLYEVSTFGRVRNNKGEYLTPIFINSGYYTYRLYTGKHDPISGRSLYKTVLIHRLVLDMFTPINNSKELTGNHLDGNKRYNNIYNLEWLTQSENNIHAKSIGLNTNFGTTHYRSKLNEPEVRLICESLEKNVSYDQIIKMIGPHCNEDIVGNIKRRITYNSISKDYNF